VKKITAAFTIVIALAIAGFACRLVHAGSDDFAGDHYRERRIVARGAERIEESNQRFYAYNHFGQHPERLLGWFAAHV
jgi:hypothetical protein